MMNFTLTGTQRKELFTLEDKLTKEGRVTEVLKIVALRRLDAGASIDEVASDLNMGPWSVRRILTSWLLHGLKSIKPCKKNGRPKILSYEEEEKIAATLLLKPSQFGLGEGPWTARTVKQFISNEFQKSYSMQRIAVLLKHLGFSFKKAVSISKNRNQQQRELWIEEKWPIIVKNAEEHGSEIVFADESNFNTRGTLSHCWVPKGVVPEIEMNTSKTSLSTIGGIGYFSGSINALTTERTVHSGIMVNFLEILLKEIPGHIHVVLDNCRIHHSNETWIFIKKHSKRLTVHFLPAYSPDFNPIEKLWSRLKNCYLANRFFSGLNDLKKSLSDALSHFRRQPEKILNIFKECPY